MKKSLDLKNALFVIALTLGSIIIIKFSGVHLDFALMCIVMAVLIFSKFYIIKYVFEKKNGWRDNDILFIMGMPWKLAVWYIFYIVAMASFVSLGDRFFPGDPQKNIICFCSTVILSVSLGTWAWFVNQDASVKKELAMEASSS